MFLRLGLNGCREGFCRRGRGRSFQAEGPKTEKARKPTVDSLLRGIWRLRVSEAARRVLQLMKGESDLSSCNFDEGESDLSSCEFGFHLDMTFAAYWTLTIG